MIGAGVIGLTVAVWLTPVWLPALITGLVSGYLLRRSGAPGPWWNLTLRYVVFGLIALALGVSLFLFVNDQRSLFFWDTWRIAQHADLAREGALLPIDDEPSRLGRLLAMDAVAWALVAGLPGAALIAACMLVSPETRAMPVRARISHRLVVAVLLTGLLGVGVATAAFTASRFLGYDEVGLHQPEPILVSHAGPDGS